MSRTQKYVIWTNHNRLICAEGVSLGFYKWILPKTMMAKTVWTKSRRGGNKNLLQNGRKLITKGKYRAKKCNTSCKPMCVNKWNLGRLTSKWSSCIHQWSMAWLVKPRSVSERATIGSNKMCDANTKTSPQKWQQQMANIIPGCKIDVAVSCEHQLTNSISLYSRLSYT
jgi:hypothetical protein